MKNILMFFIGLFSGASCSGSKADYQSVDNAQFSELLARGGVQLVDVRTPGEFAGGYIPDAVNLDINSSDFDAAISRLDTARPVAVYCRSGARSRTASRRLAAQGFEVYNLKNGIVGWDGPVSR